MESRFLEVQWQLGESMNYIVFDLEWNQGNAETTVSEIPFEILEIGAVKLNERFEQLDTFQILVRPTIYNEMNYQTHKVVPLDIEQLRQKGVGFDEAVHRFFDWCGERYQFCTWGNMDLTELQRNMYYYGIETPFKTPVFYYDVQRGYSLQVSGAKGLTALEEAAEYFGIPKGAQFHRALGDAEYTAKIMQKLDMEQLKLNFAVDCYHNPKSRKEQITVNYPQYQLFISREFADKEALMRDKEVRSTRCYRCHKPAKRTIRWYSSNNNNYFCLAQCEEHGVIIGKIRIKRTDKHRFFAEKILRLASKEEAQEICLRREEIRKRRRKKRQKQKK